MLLLYKKQCLPILYLLQLCSNYCYRTVAECSDLIDNMVTGKVSACLALFVSDYQVYDFVA